MSCNWTYWFRYSSCVQPPVRSFKWLPQLRPDLRSSGPSINIENRYYSGRGPMDIVRIEEVTEITGLSRTSIWRRVKTGEFPNPLRLGGSNTRAVGWRRSDIDNWIAGLRPADDEASQAADEPDTGPVVQDSKRAWAIPRNSSERNASGGRDRICSRVSSDRKQRRGGSYLMAPRLRRSSGSRPLPGIARPTGNRRIAWRRRSLLS